MGALEDLLDDLKQLAEDIEKTIEEDPGPLTPPDDDVVGAKLDSMESKIDQILDYQSIPSLNPSSAGLADTSQVSWDASEYADHFVTMATDAHRAIPGDDDTCGDNLRTMKHRFTGFRSVCGI